ncbi:hypothetical protein L7F22_026318 [Adiantum nelumboides]|nr:hypothetical protein [Adiantum nelumboides]
MPTKEVQTFEGSSKVANEVESAQSCLGLIYQNPMDYAREHIVRFAYEVEEISDLEIEEEVKADSSCFVDTNTSWETKCTCSTFDDIDILHVDKTIKEDVLDANLMEEPMPADRGFSKKGELTSMENEANPSHVQVKRDLEDEPNLHLGLGPSPAKGACENASLHLVSQPNRESAKEAPCLPAHSRNRTLESAHGTFDHAHVHPHSTDAVPLLKRLDAISIPTGFRPLAADVHSKNAKRLFSDTGASALWCWLSAICQCCWRLRRCEGRYNICNKNYENDNATARVELEISYQAITDFVLGLTWTAFLWVKVDLNAYKNYDELLSALEGMFYSPPVGEGVRFLHARDFVLTYEDKEGDWMLVGDVPWGMFVNTVKRLRITRGSDSTCLGPFRRIYLPEGLLDIPEKFLENSSYGFDPFGLSKKAVDFDKYQAYELIHARWAMLGAVGFVILEALNKYGTSCGTEAVWFQDMLMSFMLDDIVGGCNDGDPELLLFISFSNLEDIDFSTAAAMNPIQFPENFGAQTIRISFIGLQGEATQLKRDAVANIVYEAFTNPTEHRYIP